MNYIGIDLGGTNIKGALVSAEGEILKEHSIPTRVDLGPEAVAGRIGQVIAQLSDGESAVGGVGVGCPGTVDDASGIVRFAANLNFVNFDLRSALRAHTALPIHLGNDANAAALGEALFGCCTRLPRSRAVSTAAQRFSPRSAATRRARRSWRTTSSIWPAGSQILSTFSSPKCWPSRAA